MTKFQYKDRGWHDYNAREDANLRMAYISGHQTCRTTHKQYTYEINFETMQQKNINTGKVREVRPPWSLKGKRPSAPLIPKGQTMMVQVPQQIPHDNLMRVKHPRGGEFQVQIPLGAQSGAMMMVPVPPEVQPTAPPPPLQQSAYPQQYAPPPAAGSQSVLQPVYDSQSNNANVAQDPSKVSVPAPTPDAPPAPTQLPPNEKHGMSTGAKVAAGVGGLAAAGAITGAVLLDQGVFSLDDVGDFFVDAGEGIVGGFEDLGEAIVDLF